MKTTKRRRGDRKDGIWLRDLDAMHAFTPYLYPNRADNEAFIRDVFDLTAIDEFLAKKNAANPEMPYKLFHVILAAVVKAVTLRPKMNRFVQGSRMYQRNVLTTAFVVKKQFDDESHEALAYLSFDGDATLDSIHQRILEEIRTCRSDKLDNSTAGMDALTKLPRFVLRFVMWILHRLDYYGRVPNFLIKTDPNYASVFFSNLGSIKLQAGYHHLANWGTNSLFVTIGQVALRPVYAEDGSFGMHRTVELGLTIDERIADGYYYSDTVRLLKYLLQHPELLELPATTPVDMMAGARA
ncbi:MAG: hypothetical protein HFF17_00865 [Oscillospiraceae bacterium]|nr:hypothetical protein [Oscillospiraceae bacterium]